MIIYLIILAILLVIIRNKPWALWTLLGLHVFVGLFMFALVGV